MSTQESCTVPVDYKRETSISRSDDSKKCRDRDDSVCGNSKSAKILEEFQRLYEERLRKLDGETPYEAMELKLKTLTSWINDLGEQNLMLVETVEQLEREAAGRVALLEERLRKSSHIALEYMKKLEEYDNQFLDMSDGKVQSLVQPIRASSKLVQAQQTEEILRTRVSNLQNDISGLLELIRRARCDGSWDVDGLGFLEVTYDDIFGSFAHQASDNIEDLSYSQTRLNALHRKLGDAVEECHEKDDEIKVLQEQVTCLQTDVTLKDIQIKNLIEKIEILKRSNSNVETKIVPKPEKLLFDDTVMINIFSEIEDKETLKQRTDGSGVEEEMDLSVITRKLEDIHSRTACGENVRLMKENEFLSSDLQYKNDKIADLTQSLTEVGKKKGVSFASPTKDVYKLQVSEPSKSFKEQQNGAALTRKCSTENNDYTDSRLQFCKPVEECRVNIVLAQAAIEETVEELETVTDILRSKEEKIQDMEVPLKCLQSSLMHFQEDVNILQKVMTKKANLRTLEINDFHGKLQELDSVMNDIQKRMDEYVQDKESSQKSQVQSEQKIKKLQMELESVQEDLELCLKVFEPADMSSSDIE